VESDYTLKEGTVDTIGLETTNRDKLFLKLKTEGITAWSTIKSFTRGGKGRAALSVLMAQFMGASIRTVLFKDTEATLHNIAWYGRSGSWTFRRTLANGERTLDDLGDS